MPAHVASEPANLPASHHAAMSCLADKPKKWDVPGKYGCQDCRATSNSKKKLCEPVKLDKKK
jgi:hypothetical protein